VAAAGYGAGVNDDFSPLLFVMCSVIGAVFVVGVLAAVFWFRRTPR
jgi:hypothetical protein